MYHFSESCKGEIKEMIKANEKKENLDDLKIKKNVLEIISKKILYGIKGKQINKIKKKTFKILQNYKDDLNALNIEFKHIPKNKNNLNKLIKKTFSIDKNGEVFKVLMKL